MTTLWWVALATAVAAGMRGTWSPCGLSMVTAINPFSERARGHRYPVTCAWFVAGSVVGGLALGGAAALAALAVRSLPVGPAGAAAAGAVVLVVCLAADSRAGGFHLPLHPRQVDETWLGAYRRWVYAAGFGAQIGSGFATYIMTAATYGTVVLAALTGSPARALAVGGAFGAVRGLAVLVSARAGTPEALRDVARRLDRAAAGSLVVVGAVEVAGAGALAWAAGGRTGLLAALVAVAAVLLVAALPARRRGAPVPALTAGSVA